MVCLSLAGALGLASLPLRAWATPDSLRPLSSRDSEAGSRLEQTLAQDATLEALRRSLEQAGAADNWDIIVSASGLDPEVTEPVIELLTEGLISPEDAPWIASILPHAGDWYVEEALKLAIPPTKLREDLWIVMEDIEEVGVPVLQSLGVEPEEYPDLAPLINRHGPERIRLARSLQPPIEWLDRTADAVGSFGLPDVRWLRNRRVPFRDLQSAGEMLARGERAFVDAASRTDVPDDRILRVAYAIMALSQPEVDKLLAYGVPANQLPELVLPYRRYALEMDGVMRLRTPPEHFESVARAIHQLDEAQVRALIEEREVPFPYVGGIVDAIVRRGREAVDAAMDLVGPEHVRIVAWSIPTFGEERVRRLLARGVRPDDFHQIWMAEEIYDRPIDVEDLLDRGYRGEELSALLSAHVEAGSVIVEHLLSRGRSPAVIQELARAIHESRSEPGIGDLDAMVFDGPLDDLWTANVAASKKGRPWVTERLRVERYTAILNDTRVPGSPEEIADTRQFLQGLAPGVTAREIRRQWKGGIPRPMDRLTAGKDVLDAEDLRSFEQTLAHAEGLARFRQDHRLRPFGARFSVLPFEGYEQEEAGYGELSESYVLAMYPSDDERQYLQARGGRVGFGMVEPRGAMGYIRFYREGDQLVVTHIGSESIPKLPASLRKRYRDALLLLLLTLEDYARQQGLSRILIAPPRAHLDAVGADDGDLTPGHVIDIYARRPKHVHYGLRAVLPRVLEDLRFDLAMVNEFETHDAAAPASLAGSFGALLERAPEREEPSTTALTTASLEAEVLAAGFEDVAEARAVVRSAEGYADAGEAVRLYVTHSERELTEEEEQTREVIRGLRAFEPDAIRFAASAMTERIPPGAILVPMPSRTGDTTLTRSLADTIAEQSGTRVIEAIARESERESVRERFRRGLPAPTPEAHGFVEVPGALEGVASPIVLIDDVMASGSTFEGARIALGGRGRGLAYAHGVDLISRERASRLLPETRHALLGDLEPPVVPATPSASAVAQSADRSGATLGGTADTSEPDAETLQFLAQEWRSLFDEVGASGDPEALFSEIVRHYAEPGRHYHTLTHLRNMCTWLDDLKELADSLPAVKFAIWFHDIIYDTHREDNEARSAEWAVETLRGMGLPDGLIEEVNRLILLTDGHRLGDPSDRNGAVLIDLDLAILGTPTDVYAAYGRQIRREYAWVEPDAFRDRRSAILRRLIARLPIYQTELFRLRYGDQVRINLIREEQNLQTRPAAPDIDDEPSATQLAEDLLRGDVSAEILLQQDGYQVYRVTDGTMIPPLNDGSLGRFARESGFRSDRVLEEYALRGDFTILKIGEEIARNMLMHAHATGVVLVRAVEENGRRGIEIIARDLGGGIADIHQNMQYGHSEGRRVASGRGWGLPNARDATVYDGRGRFTVESYGWRVTYEEIDGRITVVEDTVGDTALGTLIVATRFLPADAPDRAGASLEGTGGMDTPSIPPLLTPALVGAELGEQLTTLHAIAGGV